MTIQWSRPTKEMEERARRRALATSLGLVTGLLLVCICAGASGISWYLRDSDSAPVRLSPRDLRVGECFGEPPERDLLQVVPVVPCNEPHRYETFGRIPIYVGDTGAFPGEPYLEAFAEGQCAAAFESYVGVPMRRAPLAVQIIKPDAEDWARNRREVLCILSNPDLSDLTVSQANNHTLSREINIMAAMVGECLIAPDVGSDNLVTGLAETTACGQLHDLEVYAVVPIMGNAYPGLEAVAAQADDACTTGFERYVGIPQSHSSLGYDTYFPSEQGWNEGERNIVCVLLSQNGEKLRGSMADSGTATQPLDTVAIRDLRVGTCFDDTGASFELSGSVLAKHCNEPHLNELFHRDELPGAADSISPDFEAILAAEQRCLDRFTAYVGMDFYESSLEIYTLSPTESEWADGERAHLCVLYDRDYAPMSVPARDSGDATSFVNRYEGAEFKGGAALAPGDCFLDPKDLDFTRPLVALPCQIPHANEFFARVELADDGQPFDADTLGARAVVSCLPEFEPYVGLPYEESVLEIRVLLPTAAEWDAGSRAAGCYVIDPETLVLNRAVRDSGDATAYPRFTESGERVDLTTLQAGDCIAFPPNFEKSNDVFKVSCEVPHEQEVFAVGAFDAPEGAPFPDFVEIDRRIAEVCPAAFESYVGIPYPRSTLDYTYLGLSATAWARGERMIVCTLLDSTFNPLTAPMRGSEEATAFPPDTVPNAMRVPLRSLPAESCYYQPVDFYKSDEVLQVDCTAPHAFELYAIEIYPESAAADAPYPDFATLTDFADQRCRAEFAAYIGLPFGESALGYTTDYPDQREWAALDRRVFCLLFGYNYEEFTGLLKGSRR